MDGIISIYLDRAQNEIKAASILFAVSNDDEKKTEFRVDKESTFYSSVISHSYYAIFFAAQAILIFKGYRIKGSNVHKKTYDAFEENIVKTGFLDASLLEIYEKLIICADELLNIFEKEKGKRARFTYETIPQSNFGPASSSLNNARKFVANIIKVIEVQEAQNIK